MSRRSLAASQEVQTLRGNHRQPSPPKGLYGLLWGSRSLFVAGVLIAALNSDKTATDSPAQQTKTVSIGEEGYLRLPGVDDPEQMICLGATEEGAKAITKALLAKDVLGLLEIPGTFCVGNGSKVLKIENGITLTRVRLISGTRPIDADNAGRSGWAPFEWVSAE